MNWRIWISQDTCLKQKVMSASFAISKPCGVEAKLQVKIVITNPWSYYWEHSIVCYHVEFNNRIFYSKPTLDKYLWIQTISRGEKWHKVWISIVKGLPNMNISPGRDPYTVVTVLLRGSPPGKQITICSTWFFVRSMITVPWEHWLCFTQFRLMDDRFHGEKYWCPEIRVLLSVGRNQVNFHTLFSYFHWSCTIRN